ncbi:MAG: cytochrome c-type biogenesis protein CcmH [Nocardioidaceae bacterium]
MSPPLARAARGRRLARRSARWLLALAATLVALALPGAALAADCPRTSLGDVEDEVMCPVCGTSLQLATEAPQAQRERAFIQRLVDDCRSKDEVKDALVAEFGDEVLALPEDEGFDLAAYIVPALALLLGATAVGAAALRWRRRRTAPEGPATPGPANAQLEADMERYEL